MPVNNEWKGGGGIGAVLDCFKEEKCLLLLPGIENDPAVGQHVTKSLYSPLTYKKVFQRIE
jgi:hypothetical protein